MAYTYVQAYYDYGPRNGPVQAFVVHMAEGGGTVGYLSRPSIRGVSVHYVIEYSGRIVQMLREDRASGSINPDDLRTTDGPPPYGATVRRQVMGAWDRNPNEAVITLELEGFQSDGPNAQQRFSLAALVDDVRSRYPDMGLLGHRDFTSRKACPGPHIPWDRLGGHGPAGQQVGGDMAVPTAGNKKPYTGYEIALSAGRDFYNDGQLTDRRGAIAADQSVPFGGTVQGVGSRMVCVSTAGGYEPGSPRRWTWVYISSAGTPVQVPPPDGPEPLPPATLLTPGIYEVRE